MSGNKYGSEKQIQAVTSNLKEDQYLEKTLQTLSLEETYALKLLHLDNRIIKVNYRRLRERVTKIKSYLNADDIVVFKTLEQENKMKPLYGQVNLSGISKIRAAAKRLKLETPPNRRTKSANPKMLRRGEMAPRTIKHKPEAYNLRRPNSVTGVFVDEPDPETAVRRLSLDDIHKVEKMESPIVKELKNQMNSESVEMRSRSADIPRNLYTPDLEVPRTRKSTRVRPATTLGVPARERARKDSLLNKSKYAFSSHNLNSDTPKNKSTEETEWGSPRNTGRRWSVGSGDSIEAFGPDPHEERRKNLLKSEKDTSDILETQKEQYLTGVNQFISEGPPVEPNFIDTEEVIRDIDSCKLKPKYEHKSDKSKCVSKEDLEKHLVDIRLNLDSPALLPEFVPKPEIKSRSATSVLDRSLRFDDIPQILEPEKQVEEYLTPLERQWREIRKTRYLRARDSQMDMTGVVTLAQDQGKIARAWKEFTKKKAAFKTGLDDDL